MTFTMPRAKKEEYDAIKDTNPNENNKDWPKWAESVTDVKQYQPTAQMVKSFMSDGTSAASKPMYDFEDGNDDGRPIPPTRNKGIDLAEASRYEREYEARAEAENAENEKKVSEYQKAQKDAAEAAEKAYREQIIAEARATGDMQ